ncbi:MAG: hypothetical protein OXC71_08265 [Chloroflexi bacterium]|nr:hypothetical protein [Chloroflexota bacterium]
MIAFVAVATGVLSLLFIAVSTADGSPNVPQTEEDCTGPGWRWFPGFGPDPDRCEDVGVVIDGTHRSNTPGFGEAFCGSAEAQTYRDTNIGIPNGRKFVNGSPVCFSRSWWEDNEGLVPYHPDTLRERHKAPASAFPPETDTPSDPSPPDETYIPVAAATHEPPVTLPSDRNLVYMGRNGTCGGYLAPGDVGFGGELGYQCDMDTNEWVKVRYAKTAADHQMEWFPVGACDRQASGRDPFRDAIVTRKNEDFSQEACDAWLLEELSEEFERRKKAADGGKPDPYCQIIGIHWFIDNYAYGQVFYNAPDDDGHCVSTPVFWGSYDAATNFVATDTRCSPPEENAAEGTSSTKSIASNVPGDTPPVAVQSIRVADVVTPDEALDAVEAFFDGEIDRDEFFAVIKRYFEESEDTP